MATNRLAEHNISTLQDAADLLAQIPGSALDYAATIGPHLRHVLDHYDCFLDGLDRARVDYDMRLRDVETEQHLALAQRRLSRTIARLGALPGTGMPRQLRVNLATSTASPGITTWSSPDRELQFLQSHAVHHYALMKVLAQQAGLEVRREFGVAPSTLQHECDIASAHA